MSGCKNRKNDYSELWGDEAGFAFPRNNNNAAPPPAIKQHQRGVYYDIAWF